MLEVASNHKTKYRMNNTEKGYLHKEEQDAIDSYFECVTACSIEDEGVECVTKCVEVHLKSEVN